VSATSQWEVNLYQAELRLGISVLEADAALCEATRAKIAAWTRTLAWDPEVLGRCETLWSNVERGGFGTGVAELERRRSVVDRLLT
jgi:hypothetical protein